MASPYSIKFEPNLPLMLRDGTFTYVDVFRPDAPGAFPGLLQRTPYDKSSAGSRGGFLDAIHAAMRGYCRRHPGRSGADTAPAASSCPSSTR